MERHAGFTPQAGEQQAAAARPGAGHGAGNRAVAAALSGKITMPPAVQRDFVRGTHKPHPRPKHTAADATNAKLYAETFEKEIETLKASVEGAGTSEAAEKAKVRLTEIATILRSQQNMVKTIEPAQPVAAQAIRILADRAEGAAGKAGTAREERLKVELAPRVREAPYNLRRLELLAITSAEDAGKVLAAGATATSASQLTKLHAEVLDDQRQALTWHQKIDFLDKDAASVPSLHALTSSYMRAADAAADLARRMVALSNDVVEAWKAADARKALGARNVEAAKALVTEAEVELASAEESLAHLELFAAELAIDVAEWRRDPTARPQAMDEMLAEAAAQVQAARRQRDQAVLRLDAARQNVPVVESTEGQEVANAAGAARTTSLTRAGEAVTGAEELAGLADLRTMAGGQRDLEDLLAKIPDKAQLKELLVAVGVIVLDRWVGASAIGAPKVLAALGVLGSAGLKDLVDGVGRDRVDALLGNLTPTRIAELVAGLGADLLQQMLAAGLSAAEIDGFATGLGVDPLKGFLADVSATSLKGIGADPGKLKALLAEVTSGQVKGMVTELKDEKVKGMVAELSPTQIKQLLVQLPPDVLKRTDLTGAELKQLVAEFTPAELKVLVTELGDPALKDLLTKFTPAAIRLYRTEVTAPRLKTLIVDKKLKADALFHYGSAMLKTFVGCGPNVWAHVAGVPKISATSGQVSGGHDETKFFAFINAGNPPRATLTVPAAPAAVYSVSYRTRDGVNGTKTLIQGLSGDAATWKPKLDQAIWRSIRTLNFQVGAFAGTDDSGRAYAGFYNGGDEPDTVYPV